MNATVKENILFGQKFDLTRYSEVISVCALESDLEQLPAGDGTQIGERGINLSGGQKQRLGLARACYQDADIFLLDDPLSAVDAHVGAHIFSKCIRGFLKEKTVLMACHQLQYLASADHIVLLQNETVLENWIGSYHELLGADTELSRLVREFGVGESEQGTEAATLTTTEVAARDIWPSTTATVSPAAPVVGANTGKLMTEEERQTGHVRLAIYVYYAAVFGTVSFISVFLFFSAGQLFQVITDWWMGRWSVGDRSGKQVVVAGTSTQSTRAQQTFWWSGCTFVRNHVLIRSRRWLHAHVQHQQPTTE
jgi:ATP-binding cassette subfamily C (CFTR/MRP) protein 4